MAPPSSEETKHWPPPARALAGEPEYAPSMYAATVLAVASRTLRPSSGLPLTRLHSTLPRSSALLAAASGVASSSSRPKVSRTTAIVDNIRMTNPPSRTAERASGIVANAVQGASPGSDASAAATEYVRFHTATPTPSSRSRRTNPQPIFPQPSSATSKFFSIAFSH